MGDHKPLVESIFEYRAQTITLTKRLSNKHAPMAHKCKPCYVHFVGPNFIGEARD